MQLGNVCFTAILQYKAVCFLDEAIIGHTHMMILDYGLCVHLCVVCVSISFAEKNYKEIMAGKPCWPMRGNFYVIVYMVASALCQV